MNVQRAKDCLVACDWALREARDRVDYNLSLIERNETQRMDNIGLVRSIKEAKIIAESVCVNSGDVGIA